MRTPKLHAPSPDLAERLNEHGENLAWLRIRVLGMEALLSRWPALRRFLRTLPRNLKAHRPHLIPFTAQAWSCPKSEESRVAATVAYLRAHPGASANATARGSVNDATATFTGSKTMAILLSYRARKKRPRPS